MQAEATRPPQKGGAERLAELDETGAFAWGDGDSLGEFAAEDLVLGYDKLEVFGELPIGGGGEKTNMRWSNRPMAAGPAKTRGIWGKDNIFVQRRKAEV